MRYMNPFLTEEAMLASQEEMLARVREAFSRDPARFLPARPAPRRPPVKRKRLPPQDPLRDAGQAEEPSLLPWDRLPARPPAPRERVVYRLLTPDETAARLREALADGKLRFQDACDALYLSPKTFRKRLSQPGQMTVDDYQAIIRLLNGLEARESGRKEGLPRA